MCKNKAKNKLLKLYKFIETFQFKLCLSLLKLQKIYTAFFT
jgi:hypothetical protein